MFLLKYINVFLPLAIAEVRIYPETKIQEGPYIPNHGKVNAGKNITINCKVENHTKWQNEYNGMITWKKNLEDIAPKDSKYIIEEASLTVNDLDENDSGFRIYYLFKASK